MNLRAYLRGATQLLVGLLVDKQGTKQQYQHSPQSSVNCSPSVDTESSTRGSDTGLELVSLQTTAHWFVFCVCRWRGSHKYSR